MATYKVKRNCFTLGRMYRRDDIVTLADNIKVTEHFVKLNRPAAVSSGNDDPRYLQYEAMNFNDLKELAKEQGIKTSQKSREAIINELVALAQD